MKITLRFFSSLREQLGFGILEYDTQAMNLALLREELMFSNPAFSQALRHGQAVRMAVNQEVCDESKLLTEGCEVAFFPPVTGG